MRKILATAVCAIAAIAAPTALAGTGHLNEGGGSNTTGTGNGGIVMTGHSHFNCQNLGCG